MGNMMAEKYSEEEKKIINVGAASGLLGIAIFTAVIGICMYQNEWFDITKHAFSDLGVYGAYPYMFSAGMIVTGLCVIVFAFGLGQYLPRKLAPSSLGFFLGGIGLVGVGVFPSGTLHLGSVFFMLGCFAVSLIFLLAHYTAAKESNMAGLTLAIGFSSIFALMYFTGFAIPEAVLFIGLALYVLIHAVKMAAVSNFFKS